MYKTVSRIAQTRRESGIRTMSHRNFSKKRMGHRSRTNFQRMQLGEGSPQEKEFRSQVAEAINNFVSDGHHSPFVQAEMLNWAGISTALNRKWTEDLVVAFQQRTN
jgi:hypothetical protein